MQIPVCGTFLAKIRNCPGTLGDVNPLRNKGLRFPPRRKLASKRVQNTTLGAIAQKNTSIYQWVGVPGQLRLFLYVTVFLLYQSRKVPSDRTDFHSGGVVGPLKPDID